jgi:hypothetical protein
MASELDALIERARALCAESAAIRDQSRETRLWARELVMLSDGLRASRDHEPDASFVEVHA